MKISYVNLNRDHILPALAAKSPYLGIHLVDGLYISSLNNEVFVPEEDICEVVQDLNLLPLRVKDKRGGIQQLLCPYLGSAALLIKGLFDEKAFSPKRSIDYIKAKGKTFAEGVVGSLCGHSKKCKIGGNRSTVVWSNKVEIDNQSSNLLVVNSPGARFFNCSNLIVLNCPGGIFNSENNKLYHEGKVVDDDEVFIAEFQTLFGDYDYEITLSFEETVRAKLGNTPLLLEQLRRTGQLDIGLNDLT